METQDTEIRPVPLQHGLPAKRFCIVLQSISQPEVRDEKGSSESLLAFFDEAINHYPA